MERKGSSFVDARLSNLEVLLMTTNLASPLLHPLASKHLKRDGKMCPCRVRVGRSPNCDIAHIIRPNRASCVHYYCIRTALQVLVHCRGPCLTTSQGGERGYDSHAAFAPDSRTPQRHGRCLIQDVGQYRRAVPLPDLGQSEGPSLRSYPASSKPPVTYAGLSSWPKTRYAGAIKF